MNTIIAYMTRHGATAECARLLAEKLNGPAELIDIAADRAKAITVPFQRVILGFPIYGGDVIQSREIKDFMLSNFQDMMRKRVGLYVCGLQEGPRSLEQLYKAFPEPLLKKSVAVDNFGGRIIRSQLGLWERLKLSSVTNVTTDHSTISLERIQAFADQMNRTDY
ncbi:flavodoxin domain-containing protein [Heliophilum fasciatum]|uniref:Menaquinone-dependent protoporphyrinogen oxidase n=1 Tax=Heliophilum fasciatum TaxID=35700 RepID=A0A4V2SY16_9FIRM|nr:flavodoxin domain-containing protein [Heliophilum fasciatum]MCW2277098.1 menaquinone-dependent protoporphyrinogen oxidase [Heliophilum fasciatum]TCP68376.1 menaquinone-dependent protoporphyrinogen oxidase [Heliophilum fasciatum]